MIISFRLLLVAYEETAEVLEVLMETAILNLSFAMVVRMQGKGGDISHFWFHSEDSAYPPDSDSIRAFILNVDG